MEWIVSSELIRLRKVVASDVKGNYHKWMNDPQVTKFLANGVQSHSIESLLEYVQAMDKAPMTHFMAIIDRESNRHIGNVKLGPINTVHKRGDIGIIIGEKDCWGKGFATATISLVKQFAFDHLNLHKLTAGCVEMNTGSLIAFQRNGFLIEGKRIEQFFLDGSYRDSIILGLINKSGN